MLWWTLRQLKSSDWLTSSRVALKLGESKNPRAVKLLVAILNHENADARSGAAEALGRIGDAQAVEPLMAALRDERWAVRMNAAEALRRIGDARAVEPLVVSLKDENRHVREAAAEALGRIDPNWEKSEAARRAVPGFVAPLKDMGAQRACSTLVAALSGVDACARASAENALDRIDPNWRESEAAKLAVPGFVAGLEDLDLFAQIAAVSALKAMRWQPADAREHELFERVSEKVSLMMTRGLI